MRVSLLLVVWAINRARLAVVSIGCCLDRTRFVCRTRSNGECGDLGTAAQADKYRLCRKRSWEGLRTGDGRGKGLSRARKGEVLAALGACDSVAQERRRGRRRGLRGGGSTRRASGASSSALPAVPWPCPGGAATL